MIHSSHSDNNQVTRRSFIKGMSVAALGTSVFTGVGCGTEAGKMKYVTLGRSGIKASIFLGDRMTDVAMYEAALASGVNYWHKIGHWAEPAPYELFRNIDRDSFYCDTTVASLDEEKATEIFERMLEKTGLEYIDGFKVHSQYRSADDVKNEMGAIRAFEKLKKQGKTRYLMMSQHTNLSEVFEAAIESDMFDVIQVPVNPTVPRDYFTEDEFTQTTRDRYLSLIKTASDKNIGITAMKVFLGSPKAWDEVPNLREEISEYLPDNKSIANALIHWALAVPGVKAFGNLLYSFEELRENIEAVGGTLTDREDQGIKKLSQCMGPYVCRMCGACQKAVPGGIPVSDILRYSMYHTGYGETETARELYAKLPGHMRADAVDDYTQYERACPYGVRIGEMMRKAHTRLA